MTDTTPSGGQDRVTDTAATGSPSVVNVRKIGVTMRVTDAMVERAAEDTEAFLFERAPTKRAGESAWDYLDRVKAEVDAVLYADLARAFDADRTVLTPDVAEGVRRD